ncbi:hypothetical protein J7L33_01345, partial [Candidatus Bathyarchaeota archaeon]|nr:hypothetical protein [Candidatus Bathyarchaeota archaeon]
MSREEKTRKIKELNQKLSALKKERDKLNAETETLMEKRDKLNERVKILSLEIRELRKERDKLNEKVKELKQLRERTKAEILEKIEELKKLRREIKVLVAKKPSKSLQTLKREVEKIEWEIQTNPLSLQEEREFIERVKKLEAQVKIHEKIKRLREKRLELQAEIEALREKSRNYHEELTERAEESRRLHERMLERIKEMKKVKTEADGMHQNFLKTREKARAKNSEMAAILNQIKRLRQEIRKEEEKERK